MARFNRRLSAILLTRGVARLVVPIAVLWGIYDWSYVSWIYATVYGLLTANYVVVYVLNWLAPRLMDGPWRVRPWQTFVLLANMIALPIVYSRSLGVVPWGFIAISVLLIAALYAGTVIVIYLNQRLPMAAIFARARDFQIPEPRSSTPRPPE